MASDSDVVLVPDLVEYRTDKECHKRVGFIECEEPKMSPLPEDKEKEKTIKAMESLNVKEERKERILTRKRSLRRLMRLRKMMTTMALTLMLSLRRLSLYRPIPTMSQNLVALLDKG